VSSPFHGHTLWVPSGVWCATGETADETISPRLYAPGSCGSAGVLLGEWRAGVGCHAEQAGSYNRWWPQEVDFLTVVEALVIGPPHQEQRRAEGHIMILRCVVSVGTTRENRLRSTL